MSDFVQFPKDVYERAGNVFEAFDPATSRFTIGNARSLMWFAQLAYEVDNTGQNDTTAKVQTIATSWGFERIIGFRAHKIELGTVYDTTGLIGIRSNAVVLAFAGTDAGVWETIATDARLRIDENTHTHRGFQAAADAPEVVDAVSIALSTRSETRPLFICGHSLGAALGIIAALTAARDDRPPRAVYGYGTPRPGDRIFRDQYNASLGRVTYRLVHARDLVARVPMSFLGYRHVGRLLECGVGEKFEQTRLSQDVSSSPDADAAFVAHMFQVGGSSVSDALTGLVTGGLNGESVREAISRLLQPAGHGPLTNLFKFLPPPIREHLQDQYIEALAP